MTPSYPSSLPSRLLKVLDRMFSPSAAGLYMILFAAAIGVATFIENDFGTSSAQKLVFRARWFELLLVLFGITLIVNIFRFRMIRQRKWAVLTFHASMVIILIGAGVTRYFGYEGMMHIREGSAANSFLSTENYLLFEAAVGGERFSFEEPVHFATKGDNSFHGKYLLGGKEIAVEVVDFMPNPAEVMKPDPVDGIPVIKVVVGGMQGREEYFLRYGTASTINGTRFTFGTAPEEGAFNIRYADKQLSFVAGTAYTRMVMATQTRDSILPGVEYPVTLRSLYANDRESFVFGDFEPQARVDIASSSPKMESSSMGGVRLKVSSGGQSVTEYVFGANGVEGRPRTFSLPGVELSVAYGAKRRQVPFSLELRDFILERYPGTDNPSSYASEVTLRDPANGVEREQRIYMNHILDYSGYRFFQSSYDQDELGTYLSVNYDAPGTIISYIGYFLLTLGMILTFFTPSSRFRTLGVNIRRLREANARSTAALTGLFLLSALPTFAAAPNAIPAEHAGRFGHVIVQDQNGRQKPMNTLANEVLRKLSRKESYEGLSAEQVMLGMTLDPAAWYHVPLVKSGKHDEVRKMLGVDASMVSYADFFHPDGSYKLRDALRSAYDKEPRDRGVLEKELIKIDERVNICSMIFGGHLYRIYPIAGDSSNSWISPGDISRHGARGNAFMEKFFPAYLTTVRKSMVSGDWSMPDQLLGELRTFQERYGAAVMPTDTAVEAELFLNRLNIFSRLTGIYGVLALFCLALLFAGVFRPTADLGKATLAAFALLGIAFALHTLGLGLRWYISGRAPWSNGYESLIYIGWTTVLAGLIFSRKSAGGLTATSALAATIMMVAGLSWLDPEITPLVPVLKSYWLTIHVSLEAGSYGFLMLGAIIGVLNLLLILFANESSRDRIYRMVRELTWISEMTLIGGLFMISIGTYLGGVWANESWGRYWGWDAKETWALVTILVYSFILHMRFIPGFRGLYAFNVASLFGLASVVMTYFGVNYYLSGLHSYAAGDPVPIPDFVYYTVFSLVVISLLAFWKHRKLGRTDQSA